MIGVLSAAADARAVGEFFELFKTPWEFFIPGHEYDLLISTVEDIPDQPSARALIIYQSRSTQWDERRGVVAESRIAPGWIDWNGSQFPIYRAFSTLQAAGRPVLYHCESSQPLGYFIHSTLATVRIGFDLFSEVSFLLSEGQPRENALIPTLDLHISLLRASMGALGLSFVEVPPTPAGYHFLACLTHDVDFVGIRDHKWDHTMWGFLYRSLVGSVVRALQGEMSWSRCRRNWAAAWSLPLVHLGLCEDFWLEFDRYQQIEKDLGSTFFFIPFKNVAGTAGDAPAPRGRAAKYDFAKIKEHVVRLMEKGCEIGLHGIDAWHNAVAGCAELRRIRELTGQADVGTRMHWLYWNETSPKALEEAGFSYDSTFGYNDAVGFRAGTTQPFRPLGAEHLLELPLNIQDSAMFYRDRMMLSETEALSICEAVLQYASLYGGALTVNWHTRSLSPERLWDGSYAELLSRIRTYSVWFGTAHEIVRWFRKRRAVRFEVLHAGRAGVSVTLTSPHGYSDPSFTVRVYRMASATDKSVFSFCVPAYTDHEWNGEQVLQLLSEKRAVEHVR